MLPRTARARPGALIARCVGLALALSLSIGLVAGPTPAGAQDDPPQVPTQDIIPKPNSGSAPEEAGDRGGALQLLLPALIVAALGGAVWHLTRESRRARATAVPPPGR